MNAVTISSKYQVVIPRQIREQFNLKPGNKIMFIPYDQTLRVVVVPTIEQALGMFEGIDTDPQREKVDREL
ncbi:MAG: AbrB/MazE/SpoVT family DNA-binding domain-containing protein [Anaerolineales bacterium]|nr:AbrB/MazE/SpoVT family DNA-binding domain-containing protein [Anaerolineales bacterium]MCB8940056.1 AbrB/MazE/SpoVT family DNA-binding domain-containing protein [Ardenticatenaceae bacterium]